MSKTLLLIFHPDLFKSKANAALACTAYDLPGVEVRDMQTLYPNGFDFSRDGAVEAERLLSADRVVLQFPVQWYSAPPLLNAWMNVVLTRMSYLEYETEGRRFEGTPIMVAATAGNTPETYTSGGRNMFPMIDLLSPLRATAHRCGLIWTDPFVIYRADKLSPEDLTAAGRQYAAALSNWISKTNTKLAR